MEYSNRSASDIKKEIDAGVNIPIPSFPIGVDFSENEIRKWQQEIRQTVDFEKISRQRTQIITSSLNPGALEQWGNCMAQRAGQAAIVLQAQGDKHLTLTISAHPSTWQEEPPKVSGKYTLVGAKIIGGEEFIASGTPLFTRGKVITLERTAPSADVLFTLNLDTKNPLTAFEHGKITLPVPVNWSYSVVIPSPGQKTIQCMKNGSTAGVGQLVCDQFR